LTVGFGGSPNQVDQSNDGSVFIVEIGETVLARDADISPAVFPRIFAIVFANIPSLTGRRQHLDLACKALYFRKFPMTYLIVVIELPVKMPRDLRKVVRDIGVAPSNMIVPVRGD
jgi:hypothetical protein